MKWLPMALLLVVSPVSTAVSGTFLEDFSDGDLYEWDIYGFPRQVDLDEILKIERGRLVVDTRIKKRELPDIVSKGGTLELDVGGEENWDSYTLSLRVRFQEFPIGLPLSAFSVTVRKRWHRVEDLLESDSQIMSIYLEMQWVLVSTNPPGDPPGQAVDRQELRFEDLRRPIKPRRWLPIKIVAEEDFFEFSFDDNVIAQYEDETAVPGTVCFDISTGLLVHLDDITITGPAIPNIGVPHSVNDSAHLAATWGEIKRSAGR